MEDGTPMLMMTDNGCTVPIVTEQYYQQHKNLIQVQTHEYTIFHCFKTANGPITSLGLVIVPYAKYFSRTLPW